MSNETRYPNVASVEKGFAILGFAATFVAAIQAQVMTISINASRPEQTPGVCLANALFVGGLVLDLVASFLAFLTARWLQRLSEEERSELERTFSARSTPKDEKKQLAIEEMRFTDRITHFWCSLSLFIPMPLVVLGVMCMALGLQIYIWTRHKLVVGILVSLAYLALVPFVVGVFFIGSGKKRRMGVIHELGKRQGDW
ncbi:hypothetical protein FRC19_010589 [Serendipita sp. 401]|nr:hypothetical protein FRC19_010589 [Serendipita sp. 401]